MHLIKNMNFEQINRKIYPGEVNTLGELNKYSEEVCLSKEEIIENDDLFNDFCDGIETILRNNEDEGAKRKVFLVKLSELCREFSYAEGIERIRVEIKAT